MTRVLFAGDVAQVAQVPMQTINEWAAKGVLSPMQNSRGTGRHRMFRVIDAVALAYAYQWRKAGLGLALVKEVVTCVSAFDEEGLRTELAACRRVVWTVPGGVVLIVPPPGIAFPEMLDLKRVYQVVNQRLAKIDRKHSRNPLTLY